MDLKTVTDLATIATPIFIFVSASIVVPELRKMRRERFLLRAEVKAIIFANRSMNGVNKGIALEWGRLFDAEFSRLKDEKKFVEAT